MYLTFGRYTSLVPMQNRPNCSMQYDIKPNETSEVWKDNLNNIVLVIGIAFPYIIKRLLILIFWAVWDYTISVYILSTIEYFQ